MQLVQIGELGGRDSKTPLRKLNNYSLQLGAKQ